jgi:dTDP-4-amino-4,6-dideoxygalactose transaminase
MKNSLRVLVADPKRGYHAHKEAIDRAILKVLGEGHYILGKEVAAFEASFAEFVGARAAVGVASGTDALVLALRAHGIERGDGVVTVSHTSVATVAAVELVGAVPVLADIEPTFYTLDPASLERALAGDIAGGDGNRPPIKAVIVVHLYGQPASMSDIASICASRGLVLIEDCAQAHGARLGDRSIGSWGTAAFSFYPTKNLGALGDGGAVTTNDQGIADKIKMLREYGWRQRYVSEILGINSRLDELQAAVLSAKLPWLAEDNRRRQAIALAYDEGLGDAVAPPARRAGANHVFYQYVVRVAERQAFRDALRRRGIGTNVHYPVPVHLQPAYRDRIWLVDGALPVTERAANEVLSLPMFPELTDDEVVLTIQTVLNVRGGHFKSKRTSVPARVAANGIGSS